MIGGTVMYTLNITIVTFLILHATNSTNNTSVPNSLLKEDLSELTSDEQSEQWDETRSSYNLPLECREGIYKSIKNNK